VDVVEHLQWASGDAVFIKTCEDWPYLVVLIDLCKRKMVGWAMPDRNEELQIFAASRMAIIAHRGLAGLIEQGSVFGRNQQATRI
jgi:Integrase core domain.